MRILENETFVLTGDSVTDCGRARPVGEGNGMNLGDGYPRFIHALLDSVYPQRHIRVLNTGVSGNTSRDLRARWQTDVLDLKPDWVSVMIGINDVWRQMDLPLRPDCHVYPDEYRENLCWMVEQTLSHVKGMLLISPCFMEPLRQDAMRASADAYAAIAREVAQRYHIDFVDAQAEMDRYFRHYHTAAMSWDRVHPNHVGHMLIAHAVLNKLGFDWNYAEDGGSSAR